ncbi:oligosaccharide flippase family protein [Vibrio alfacsensis]|uniref:oligosaccharide flippase family protein n=1 Tax=Vibrio TaxID=662 RepID=UPI00406801C7
MLNRLLQYAPVQLASALSVFSLIAIQTRYLGAEGYGLLSVCLVLVEITRSIYSQWLNTALIRHYPSASKTDKNTYSNIVFSSLIKLFLPVAIAFTTLAIIMFKQVTLTAIFILLFLLSVKSAFIFFQEMARLTENARSYRKAAIVQSFLSILLTWFFLSLSPNVATAIAAMVLSYVIALPIIVFKPGLISLKADNPLVKNVLTYGLPLLLSGLVGVVGTRVDRLFIASTLGLGEAGIYSALSNTLLGLMALVFMVVALPLYPDLASKVENKQALYDAHKKYQVILLTISLPALIGLCLISQPLIRLFLTPEYLIYGDKLFWALAFSAFILNLKMHYVDHGLQFTSKTKHLLYLACFNTSINILLLFILLTIFGVYGAAYASLISNITTILFSLYLSKKAGHQYLVSKDSIKVAIATLVMSSVTLLVQRNLPVEMNDILLLMISIPTAVLAFSISFVLLNILNVKSIIVKKIREKYA